MTKRSRRWFLQSVAAAPLSAVVRGLEGGARAGPLVLVPGPPSAGASLFPRPHFIRYDSRCFTINDRDAFIFSASFHYPRCPRELWRDRLVKLQRAGFNTIETYVFWNYHEPVEGHADLSEFEDFVKLVDSMGFWMIVRPGPYVCAEWDAGGFPHWVTAQRFPLRSNHPKSIATSEHWFSEVMPVIRRHLVTHSGPIILVQIENEYDYWTLAEEAKREYLRALARTAWDGGIDVPLITCWTREARERSHPDMARLADFCNFYPRWNIVKEVVPGLARLRAEEPASPLGVTELQGGWFSEVGGKLSVDQDGVSAAQLDALSKTVIEQGATFFSYYMGFGGTNFDWAAKKLTTTYDYAAPVREPGGLWEKYYAARGVGASLRLLGSTLARAEAASGASSTNASVSLTERASGKSGVVLVRENGNAEQRYKMSFPDPNSPTHRMINVPREGELVLGARQMKMLPLQIPITGGQIRYSTAEVLSHGDCGRPYVIIYDEPGRLVELSLATENEPHLEGDTVYQYWDSEYESVVVGLRVGPAEKMLLFNGHLQIVVLPRERAWHSWTAVFPPTLLPEGQPGDPSIDSPFLTDSALMWGDGWFKNTGWADLDFAPGVHAIVALLPSPPSRCYVNGLETDFQYDRHWLTARVSVTAPPLPVQPIALDRLETWVERFDASLGDWATTTPERALEDLGPLPYGYVKYRAEFTYHGEPKMFITAFADDGKKVFLNGKLVPEASRPKTQVEFPLAGYARSGANTLEIAYELFGSPNFGDRIGELKGIESMSYGNDPQSAAPIASWQAQRFAVNARGRGIDPDFPATGRTRAALGSSNAAAEIVPAFTWCRAEFALEKPPEGWSVQWKATFEATRDALLYLNGRFVGRYAAIGPQKDFYLPEPYLSFDSKRMNVLSVVLAYCNDARPIGTFRIAPYTEFATYRVRVAFEW